MFLNDRTKSKELIYYEALSRRCNLTKNEQWHFRNLKSGFEGEAEYDRIFDDIGHGKLLIYRDLWMKVEKAILQVDSLIITEDMLVVNEIKNYSENYLYENGGWFREGKQSGEDPLAQASRTAGKLVKLTRHLSYRCSVQKKIVFINPNFNLRFNSRDNEQFIVTRPGVPNYFKELKQMYAGHAAHENANEIRRFIIENPMELTVTDPTRVRMENYCYQCGGFDLRVGKYKAICNSCGYEETTERLFVRAVIDFSVLFHNIRTTSTNMYVFIDQVLQPRTIRKFLNKYCHKIGDNKSTSYVVKSNDLRKLLLENGYSSNYEKDEKYKFIKTFV